MLTIGDFAQITHLSRKTLRHYHEAGLLEPEQVDAATGYRYYSTAQVPTAQVIRRFRELGMPVAEVRSVLLADVEERSELIAAHLTRLETQLASTQAAVTSLRRLLSPTPPTLTVGLRSAPARVVAGIGGDVERSDVLAWYSGAMAELSSLGLEETGPCGGLYDNELFTEERGHMTVYLTVAAAPVAGRVSPVEIPAAELAVTVHRRAARRHRRDVRRARHLGRRSRARVGRSCARDLPRPGPGHVGRVRVADRDRLACLPHDPVGRGVR